MKTTKLMIVLLTLAVGSPALPAISAAEEHDEGVAKIPATVSGVWQEIKEHEDQLAKAIAAKKIEGVHEIAFAIRDMVNALPGKSKLDADKLAKLQANAKYVSALASRLDESGDANDLAGTEANFKKLQRILKNIESLYPPEQLKGDMKNMGM